MKVTTNIRKMDLIRFQLSILPKLPSSYITIVVMALFTLGLICWKSGVPESASSWILAITISLGSGFLGMLFSTVFSINSVLLMSSSKNGTLGEHEYTLTPEGLYEKTSANEGLNRWSGIINVEVLGSNLLFEITGYLFHIVPAKSFKSKAAFNEYVSLSKKYWQNSHNK